MVKINLLPWREERRQQLNKEFLLILAGGALLAVLSVALVMWLYNQSIDFQNKRNAYLKTEIAKLDKDIAEIKELESKKAKLLSRKEVIEELQGKRTQMVHLFDELVKTIPNGVFLESVKQQGNRLTLEGYAQSHSRVSAYLRAIEKSKWLSKPEVQYIKADDTFDTHEQKFKLTAQLVNPNAPQDDAIAEEVAQ